jgi:cyclase
MCSSNRSPARRPSATQRLSVLLTVAVLSVLALDCRAEDRRDVDVESPFRVERLADGVWLFRPVETRVELTNSVVVERDDGLLVAGAQPTPAAARELLAAIPGTTPKPVRYLVLLSPHAEAAGGASAFPESVLVTGTAECATALGDPAFDFGAEARLRWSGPGPWTDPPRVEPTLAISFRAHLADAKNPVNLLAVVHAHTPGDMMVQLPEERILVMGALLSVDRNPHAGAARVGNWLGVLNRVSRDAPSVLVPLRGPAGGIVELRRFRDSLAWLRGQVDRWFVEGIAAERIPDQILGSSETADRFDIAAEPNFLRGLIDQTVAEAHEQRRKRGME